MVTYQNRSGEGSLIMATQAGSDLNIHFPVVLGVGCDGNVYITSLQSSWQPCQNIADLGAGNAPAKFVAIASDAGMDGIHVVGITVDGNMYHCLNDVTPTYSFTPWGNVKAVIGGTDPGIFTAVTCTLVEPEAGPPGPSNVPQLHVIGVVAGVPDNVLYHTVRHSDDGSWAAWDTVNCPGCNISFVADASADWAVATA